MKFSQWFDPTQREAEALFGRTEHYGFRVPTQAKFFMREPIDRLGQFVCMGWRFLDDQKREYGVSLEVDLIQSQEVIVEVIRDNAMTMAKQCILTNALLIARDYGMVYPAPKRPGFFRRLWDRILAFGYAKSTPEED